MTQTCIIVGASHAAAQLVPSLRQEGWEGEIVLIGDEGQLPYHRPPLSKAFLSGEKGLDDLAIRPAAFYDKHEVVRISAHVESIDRQQQTLALDDGQSLAYDKLVLCTGARVRTVELPGVALAGVHYLRNIADVQAMQAHMGEGRSAVIIGGGYIGLETAASLRKQGMKVTLLEMTDRILQRVTTPELSEFYTRVHQAEGVAIHTRVAVSEIVGSGHVEQVICSDGQTFDADMVVIGIGVLPNVELAQAAGLAVDNGIVVDEHCATEDPNIFAAGDCTQHYNKRYDRHIRLESVPNASEQAKVVAAVIAGKSKVYDSAVIRGDSQGSRSFAVFYFVDDRLIAADCVNRPQEFMLCKKLLASGLSIEPSLLVDEGKAVKDLLALATPYT